MSWLDDRKAETVELERRKSLILAEAEGIYESLWKQINEFINEAKGKGFSVDTNGSPLKRVVSLLVNPQTDQRWSQAETLHVELAQDRRSITATGRGGHLHMDIDIRDDNVVFLKIDGKAVAMRDAAIKILDRFLFPQLPQRY